MARILVIDDNADLLQMIRMLLEGRGGHEVILSAEVHGFVCPPVDLPPAGETLRDFKAFALPGGVLLHDLGQFRAWSNQAHVAAQDVKELRNFVQAGAAQPLTYPCHAGVVVVFVDEEAFLVGVG